MEQVCVAYLARAHNGIQPVQEFLESYRRHPAGLAHVLALIYKGFPAEKEPEEYRHAVADLAHESFFVEDDIGVDIDAYFATGRHFDYEYFLFLNSFSIILDADWLLKMYRAFSEKDVGLVGATGSYQSIYTDFRKYIKTKQGKSEVRGLRSRIDRYSYFRQLKRHFYPYPNYHVRTNAFMLPAGIMRQLRVEKTISKMDAYRFESGKESMTQQVLKMNMRPVLVGKNGRVYDKEEWVASGTFWQADQSNLLVADNQTRAYSSGNVEERWRLSRHAWADRANPAHPV